MTDSFEVRREYIRGTGFVFADDVGHEFMADLATIPLIKQDEQRTLQPGYRECYNAATEGLGILIIDNFIPKIQALRRKQSFKDTYAIKPYDLGPNNHFNFSDGLGDFDFTWHFGAGAATSVLEQMAEENKISSDAYRNMNLQDWADIFRSSWFSNLMHDFALTRNGIYESFGANIMEYRPNALLQQIRHSGFSGNKLYNFKTSEEKTSGNTIVTAETTSELRKWLRAKMHEGMSLGCPIARRAGTLPVAVATNPHAARLFENGHLHEESRTDEHVRFRQPQTPIDTGLQVLAGHMDRYHDTFGTPYLEHASHPLKHLKTPKTNPLTNNLS